MTGLPASPVGPPHPSAPVCCQAPRSSSRPASPGGLLTSLHPGNPGPFLILGMQGNWADERSRLQTPVPGTVCPRILLVGAWSRRGHQGRAAPGTRAAWLPAARLRLSPGHTHWAHIPSYTYFSSCLNFNHDHCLNLTIRCGLKWPVPAGQILGFSRRGGQCRAGWERAASVCKGSRKLLPPPLGILV